MKIKTFDYSNKKFGVTILESEVWKVDFSPLLISLYNRYTLLNRRRVISKTKIKSEVSGGGRKPWRQKGTGRARQGSIRSPQWRGGGVVFGPTGIQNYSVGINKKEKRKAVLSILSKKASQNELIIIENLNFESHKTNQAFSLIKDLDILNKNVLFVTSRLKESDNQKIEKSFKNIKKVSLIDSRRVDVHSVLKSNFLIFTKDSILDIEKSAFVNKKDK